MAFDDCRLCGRPRERRTLTFAEAVEYAQRMQRGLELFRELEKNVPIGDQRKGHPTYDLWRENALRLSELMFWPEGAR